MTAKEKAFEIFNKYMVILNNELNSSGNIELSKVLLLILIDELIKYTPSIDIYPPNFQTLSPGVREYWKKVKQEIEKL